MFSIYLHNLNVYLLFYLYFCRLTAAKQAVEYDAAGRVQEAIYYYELSVDLLKGIFSFYNHGIKNIRK